MYNACEADYANADLVTFYGQVEKIIYSKEIVFHPAHCYLCISSSPKEPTILESQCSDFKEWMNPWNNTLDEDELIELPCAEEEDISSCSSMETGVPGDMVQIITLRDVVTGDEKSIYIKHSFTPNTQRVFRLAQGMVVCVSHLHRRKSGSEKYYFITTLLSTFRVLSYDFFNKVSIENWGVYGLRAATPENQGKMWGTLEFFNISKISISVKCSNCNTVVQRRICSETCLSKNFVSSAYAIGWLQIIQNKTTVQMEKVIIKGNHVSTLLCIPENIWKKILEAAEEEEMIYFSNSKISQETSDLNKKFQIYCHSVPKPNGKFYISVRKMTSISEELPVRMVGKECDPWKPRYGNDSRPWLLGFSDDIVMPTTSTTQDTFTADWPPKPKFEGVRRQLLREALWQEVSREVEAEMTREEQLRETDTEYTQSFIKEGFSAEPIRTDPELHRKYPLYGDTAASLWREKFPNLPGATRSPHIRHQFRRYAGFTKPLDQTLDTDIDPK